jgi:hypothetical protein
MTSIATAAGMHALATVPALLEGNQTYLYHLREDVSESLGDRNAARLTIPLGAGLGIEVDESRIKEMAGRYEQNGSFLQRMAIDS